MRSHTNFSWEICDLIHSIKWKYVMNMKNFSFLSRISFWYLLLTFCDNFWSFYTYFWVFSGHFWSYATSGLAFSFWCKWMKLGLLKSSESFQYKNVKVISKNPNLRKMWFFLAHFLSFSHCATRCCQNFYKIGLRNIYCNRKAQNIRSKV